MPINEVLNYWFGEIREDDNYFVQRQKTWFGKSAATDTYLRENFAADLEAAIAGKRDDWAATPRGRLALIVLLDQFSRNIWRGTPKSFAQDKKALEVCREGLLSFTDRQLHVVERVFFYLPLEHSEDLEIQHLSVQYFERLSREAPAPLKRGMEECYKFALRHLEIIEQFGRFPHRNIILGRKSTKLELAFLDKPFSAF